MFMLEKYSSTTVFPLLALLVSATAQAVPNAGSLGNQLRQAEPPALSAPVSSWLTLPAGEKEGGAVPSASQSRVTLNRIVFTGDVVVLGVAAISEARLQQVVSPWVGSDLQFPDLQSMAEAVTQFYRREGVLLAQATLPPQAIRGGVLTLHIVAGKYDAATIQNASALKTTVVQRMVSVTTPEGSVVRKKQLERVALLLNEIPGVNARVALKAGEKDGATSLDIALEPGPRVGGYIGLDDQGDVTTGRSRVMAGGYVNNLLGYGDQLRVDLLDAWENSNLLNGALDYSAQINGYGTRAGASYSHLNYRYNFQQMSFSGYSDNWLLYLSQPWIRTETARVDVRLDGGQQFLTDHYPSAFFADNNNKGRKRASLGGLSLSGSLLTTPGGLSTFNLRGTTGQVDYLNEVAQTLSFSRESGTAGAFSLLNYQLTHDQQVVGPLSVYASLRGQQANHNLDSSQKFLLGGPVAVRAYDVGAGAVDNGNIVTVEVRSRWGIPVRRWLGINPGITVAAFHDQGWGEQFRDNRNQVSGGALVGQNNRFSLAGSGLYTTLADEGNYALTLTWAHRTGHADPVSGQSDQDRFWVSAVKTF